MLLSRTRLSALLLSSREQKRAAPCLIRCMHMPACSLPMCCHGTYADCRAFQPSISFLPRRPCFAPISSSTKCSALMKRPISNDYVLLHSNLTDFNLAIQTVSGAQPVSRANRNSQLHARGLSTEQETFPTANYDLHAPPRPAPPTPIASTSNAPYPNDFVLPDLNASQGSTSIAEKRRSVGASTTGVVPQRSSYMASSRPPMSKSMSAATSPTSPSSKPPNKLRRPSNPPALTSYPSRDGIPTGLGGPWELVDDAPSPQGYSSPPSATLHRPLQARPPQHSLLMNPETSAAATYAVYEEAPSASGGGNHFAISPSVYSPVEADQGYYGSHSQPIPPPQQQHQPHQRKPSYRNIRSRSPSDPLKSPSEYPTSPVSPTDSRPSTGKRRTSELKREGSTIKGVLGSFLGGVSGACPGQSSAS
jgi:hypothetical protein